MLLAGVLLGGSGGALAAPPSLTWEGVFGAPATAPDVYLRAKIHDAAGKARLFTLWREGERRLGRLDEDGLELRAEDEGPPGAPAYVFTVVDRRAGTLRRVPAERAARLGPTFTWWSQAHLLSLPGPRYTLQRSSGPGTRWGGARCEWYVFTPAGLPGTRICWSRRYAVPLRIDERRGTEWWTRLSVERIGPLPPERKDGRLDTAGLRELALPEPDED
ncbi:MAG: hypothetical protein ABW123_00255 [Cystobacter sp.]